MSKPIDFKEVAMGFLSTVLKGAAAGALEVVEERVKTGARQIKKVKTKLRPRPNSDVIDVEIVDDDSRH